MYYGVTAENGFGVFDDYRRVSYSGEYLKKGKQIKKFDTLYQAFAWASERYNAGQEDFDAVFYGVCLDIKLNWIMYRRDIIRLNKKDGG